MAGPTIKDRLGSGGYGEIYSATSLENGEDVALKRLLPLWASDEDVRRRFAREGALAAAAEPSGHHAHL